MSLPLQGARVLVTRPAHQADALCQLIDGQGGIAIRLPSLEIVAHNTEAVAKKLASLDKFQWLVFISANAVNFAVKANGGKIRHNSALHLVAIGPATVKAMQAVGLAVDVMPTQPQNSEALLAMPQMQSLVGQRMLIVRGCGGREVLADTLRARGAAVDYLEVYRRVLPCTDNAQLKNVLEDKQLSVVTATSVESLQNLVVMAGANPRLLKTPLVVISERIKVVAVELGFDRVAVTEYPSDAAILQSIKMCVTGG